MNDDDNWVKKMYLQQPAPNPWMHFLIEELQEFEREPSFDEAVKETIRVEIRARRQGRTAERR